MRFTKARSVFKKRAKLHPQLHALLVVCALALVSSSTFAAPINLVPGDSVFVPSGAGPIAGTVEGGTGFPVPFVSATFNGTLTSTVYLGDATNPYGGLTFTYQLTNNSAPAPAGDIDRLTINDYAGFIVDGSYRAKNANDVPPTLVDRGVSGDVIGFSFLNLPGNLGNGPLHKGFTSALLVLQTDALNFQQTLVAVIDGSTVIVPSFSPSRNIPEPSSLILAAFGLVGLAAWGWRRKQ
jgi:hypothetical protein